MSKVAGERDNKLRILGVDPGLITTGYGLIEAVGDDQEEIASGIDAGRRARVALAARTRHDAPARDEDAET